jgi:hypothetical protein
MKTILNRLKPYINTDYNKDGNIYQSVPLTRAIEQAEIYASEREAKFKELYGEYEKLAKELRHIAFAKDYDIDVSGYDAQKTQGRINGLKYELNLK